MKTLAIATAALLLLIATPTVNAASDDCDKGGDICVDVDKGGACAAVWMAYHPLGACATTDPSVTVCTFTPPCRGV